MYNRGSLLLILLPVEGAHLGVFCQRIPAIPSPLSRDAAAASIYTASSS